MTEITLFYIFNAVFFAIFVAYAIPFFRLSLFHPFLYYLFFHGLVFVVRPLFVDILQLESVYRLYRFWPSFDDKVLAIVAANIGLISFSVGSAAVTRKGIAFRHPPGESLTETGNRGSAPALMALIALAPLALESARQSIRILGGSLVLNNMFQDPETMYTVYTDTSGYIVDLNITFGTLAVIYMWSRRYRLLSAIPLLSFILLRLYIGWGRWAFVMALASLFLLWMYDTRRRWPRPRHILIGLALLGLFGAISTSRDIVRVALFGAEAQSVESDGTFRKHYFDSLDFANLEFLEYLIYVVPQRSGAYDYFANTLEVLTAPIPRVLWPEKPIGPPIKPVNLYAYGYPIGMTYSLPGQGWFGLGWVGVVLWCGLAGAATSALYKRFIVTSPSRYSLVAFAILLPLSIQWYRDGILITALKFPLFPLLGVVTWWAVSKLYGGWRNIRDDRQLLRNDDGR